MKKSQTTNTFDSGMIMDLNPLLMSKDTYCNALNVTIITRDGNEGVLQTARGNGRVETAYLPEGYIPLGTCSLGGIIYVASYNPLTDMGLIGSFPSPERNIASSEVSDMNVILTNADFLWGDSNTGARAYYLKKDLNSDLTFNPGDKFVVYGSPLTTNFDKLWIKEEYDDTIEELKTLAVSSTELYDCLKQHTLKLGVGTITNTGKLVIFDNLKKYKFLGDSNNELTTKYKYIIFEYTGTDTKPSDTDLDDYRSLISQPYNIFGSKVSGKLVLIAELVLFDDFDLSIINQMGTIKSGENVYKTYLPSFTFDYAGDYPFIPYGAQCLFTMTWDNDPEGYESDIEDKKIEESYDYIIDYHGDNLRQQLLVENNGLSYSFLLDNVFALTNDKAISDELTNWSNVGFFDSSDRNTNGKINYTFIPCMIWGPVTYLAVSGQIDLDKIGTGYVGLTLWRYYNDDNTCSINWGLEVYEEEGYCVSSVRFEMTRLVSLNNGNGTETVVYNIDQKSSYFGVFFDKVLFNTTSGNFEDGKYLKKNQLYLVKIIATYQEISSGNTEEKISYRWLYTNSVFNSYYNTHNDFKDLELNMELDIKTDYTQTRSVTERSLYGSLRDIITDSNKDSGLEKKESSRSGIQLDYDERVSGTATIGLKNDYNTFYFDASGDGTFAVESGDIEAEATHKNIYVVNEDVDINDYLAHSCLVLSDSLSCDDYVIDNYLQNNPDNNLFDIPTTVFQLNTEDKTSTSGNVTVDNNNQFGFDIYARLLLLIKAYSTKLSQTITIDSYFRPLAYNADTFNKYGLEYIETPNLVDIDSDTFVEDSDGTNNFPRTYGWYRRNDGYEAVNVETSKKTWNVKRMGLFGWMENGGSKGKLYGYSLLREDKIEANPHTDRRTKKQLFTPGYQIPPKDDNNVPFRWQSNSNMPACWLEVGMILPIGFFVYFYGKNYGDDDTADRIDNGTDLDTPQNNQAMVAAPSFNNDGNYPYYVSFDGTRGEETYLPFGLFVTMLDEDGECYQIPLNIYQKLWFKTYSISSTKSDQLKNSQALLKYYPGLFSFYGLPHAIALMLSNIYIFITDGFTNPGYVPNDIQYVSTYTSTINIGMDIQINDSDFENKELLIILDSGEKIDLDDVYSKVSDSNIDPTEDSEEFKENLYHNITYEVKHESVYPLTITITETDKQSGTTLLRTFQNAQSTYIDNYVLDYNGTTLLNQSTVSGRTKLLYMRTDAIGSGVANIGLASNFRPYKILYDDSGTAIGRESELLDAHCSDDYSINMNAYFTIKDEKIYLSSDHMKGGGDHLFDAERQNDPSYTDGYLDIAPLEGYKLF